MAFRQDIQRPKDSYDDISQTLPTESSTKEISNHVSSKVRVRSEPPKQIRATNPPKSHLPEIEGSYKKLLVGTFAGQGALVQRKSKKGGLHFRERSANLDESVQQVQKPKRNYSINSYTNNNNTTFSKDSTTNDISQQKITSTSIDTGAKNPTQTLNVTPLRVKSRKETRAASPEKSVLHELSEITAKAKPRLHSNLNLRPKRTNNSIGGIDNTSTSVTLNPLPYPPIDGTKFSMRKNGIIEAYAANSNQGIVRTYNEDRVSIILNIAQPSHVDYKGEWPNCSFFGVYDGHGGSKCADFLKDTLHRFVIGNKNFPDAPIQALKEGFRDAEKEFLELAQQNKLNVDQSGSCAIVILIINNKCYTANVGDSRAIMSAKTGNMVVPLSRDHKPSDENEQARILSSGGKLYQSPLVPQGKPRMINGSQDAPDPQMGPLRVLPGRLSVSRTFGDIEAKLEKYGGNPNVVVAEPEVGVTDITNDSDFIILASDGIYDRMTNEDIVNCIWDSAKHKCVSVHEQSSQAVESVMMESLLRKTFDNITVVMLSFAGFKSLFTPDGEKKEASGFYFSYENHLKAKKNTSSTTKVRSQANSKEGTDSVETEKSRLNTDESIYDSKNPAKFGSSVLQTHKKNNTITRQLIKAYRKVNLTPMQK